MPVNREDRGFMHCIRFKGTSERFQRIGIVVRSRSIWNFCLEYQAQLHCASPSFDDTLQPSLQSGSEASSKFLSCRF